jgi:hypothetical protein
MQPRELVTRCESGCGRPATKCCGLDDMPMLWFCDEHFEEHVRKVHEHCKDSCFAMPYCEVCGRPKKPQGRDAAPAMANSLCDHECEGYRREPVSGHRWPEEKD